MHGMMRYAVKASSCAKLLTNYGILPFEGLIRILELGCVQAGKW